MQSVRPEPQLPRDGSPEEGSRPLQVSQRAHAALAGYSAAGALLALLVGGVLMSFTGVAEPPPEPLLTLTRAAPVVHAVAAVALGLVSLADLGTIAALHDHLHRHGPQLVLLAAGTAVIGDLLNITGRLAQAALVGVALSPRSDLAPSAALALTTLEATLNTAGFVLVAVAFAAFGVLFLRSGRRLLGLVAMVAALGTALGQIPSAEPAFYLANVAFLLWYAALVQLFRQAPPAAEVSA